MPRDPSGAQIDDAINFWTTCGSYGAAFPQLSRMTGNFAVTVVLIGGVSTSQSGTCGQFDPSRNSNGQIIGGSIQLFDATSTFQDCEPWATQTIAHEIGHVYGLSNTACLNHIMGPDMYTVTSPATDECDVVATIWETPSEAPPPPGGVTAPLGFRHVVVRPARARPEWRRDPYNRRGEPRQLRPRCRRGE